MYNIYSKLIMPCEHSSANIHPSFSKYKKRPFRGLTGAGDFIHYRVSLNRRGKTRNQQSTLQVESDRASYKIAS